VSTTSGENLPAAGDTDPDSSTTSTLPAEPSPENDPLINEAPVDESPDPNASVPPPDRGYRGQEELRPPAVLWGNIKTAEERLQVAINDQVTAIAQARSFRLRSKHLGDALERNGAQSEVTVADIDAATGRLEARAITGFVASSSGNIPDGELSPDLSLYHQLLDRQRKHRYLDAALTVDRQSIGELNELKARLGSETLALYERSRFVETSLRRAEEQARGTSDAVEQAVIELEAFRAGSEIYVHGVTFPIAGRYSVPLIDSFGFPRMPGTPDAHWHEGIDIFAPRGTPLVATERGVVSRIGNGRLGGLKLWLRGESGADWYYAHLDGFAPGLHNGQVVEAGQLLGYVGNTGNAVGTPPHLHMQVHPNGGRPVNPYPLLKIVSDMDLAAMADGTYPGYRYEPRLSSRSQPVAEPATTTTTTTTAAVISSSGSSASDPEPAKDSPSTPNTVAEIRSRAVD
jgi:murein DD-endopeptidase MepM/ murein hydrolase activator NlpD